MEAGTRRGPLRNAADDEASVGEPGSEGTDEENAEEEDAAEGAAAPLDSWEEREEERAAANAILRASQIRIECVKVCAPAQLQELVEGAHNALGRVRGVQRHGLRRLGPGAAAEADALLTQWQQRSGTIRVVVRVRPPSGRPNSASDSEELAVGMLAGAAKPRGLTVSVPRRSGRPGAHEVHSFKRLDYVLSPDKDQGQVFQELRAMMPSATPGGLAGPPQSACILAYGQTGSGKTYTMHGGAGDQRGLVPRVLFEVFSLAGASGATVSLSAVEIYNDTAYDLLDGSAACASEAANEPSGRAFSAGRLAPPSGLSFRHGCRVALEQATSIEVAAIEEAEALLLQAAERRSTRSTCFNATSSRSHSLVLVHATLPGAEQGLEPALRIAFVDLAGSERLPAEVGGPIAEESRHINLSLSALGSVIHALRHKANHLPYRACLLTRLLEPFFKASGRVLLCVCVGPEQRHAQETLCSMAFADRASRAALGAETAQEVQRGQALSAVREAHALLRLAIRDLLPQSGYGNSSNTRLPDWLAAEILAFMPEHGGASFVCRAWSRLCLSHHPWGREFRRSERLAETVLKFLHPAMEAAGVCKVWWQVVGSFRITVESSTVKVLEAAPAKLARIWAPASAKTRADMWKAFLAAGGGSNLGAEPLQLVRECVIAAAPKPEALRGFLRRCPALRCAEIAEPGLVSSACSGLASCSKLRALKLSLTLVPNIVNLGQVLKSCKQLRVLTLANSADFPVSLQYLTEELCRSCGLRQLTLSRCSATWKDFEVLCKSCSRLQELRLPEGYVDAGGPLSPPPLIPLGRLKQLRAVDLRGHNRGQKARSWLTDDMFGILAQVRHLREVHADHQRLLSDRCCWFLRRHCFRLRVLHLSGCRAMCGESIFGLLHMCESLESVRLPPLVIGSSERKLGVPGTNRWCSGLRCQRLRSLRVDSWPFLEDSGVQMLTVQCPRLRTLWLRQSPRLSDDAVSYIAGLPQLTNLSLALSAGLTDRALRELCNGASRLRHLDLCGCRQLTEAGVVDFAGHVTGGGPRLRSLQLDSCLQLGRGAATALLSCSSLLRCSLTSCRPLPESATQWQDAETRKEACRALGVEPPAEIAEAEDDVDSPSFDRRAEPLQEEVAQCAVCMDDIRADEDAWQCPVCNNKLHDTEDCARGWLRLRQSCPTCRSAAFAPPEEVTAPLRSRRRHPRALSEEVPPFSDALRLQPSLPQIAVSGTNLLRSAPAAAPADPHEDALRPSAYPQTAPRGRRRPPRPELTPVSMPSPARIPTAVPRARSLPPVGLVLAGLSIVGSATRSSGGT